MHFSKITFGAALVAATNAAAFYSSEGLYARDAAPWGYEEDVDTYLYARDAEPEEDSDLEHLIYARYVHPPHSNSHGVPTDLPSPSDLAAAAADLHEALIARSLEARSPMDKIKEGIKKIQDNRDKKKDRKDSLKTLEGKKDKPEVSKQDFDQFAAGPAGEFAKKLERKPTGQQGELQTHGLTDSRRGSASSQRRGSQG